MECVPESFKRITQARNAKGILAAVTEFDKEASEVYQSPAANLSSPRFQHGSSHARNLSSRPRLMREYDH